jgi:peptidyl-dipeptidase Dcp
MAENLLLKLEFNTPNDYIPFPDIQLQHYIEAIQYHIDIARERIQSIEEISEPNFNTIIEALEFATYEVQYIYSIADNLNSADTNSELQEVFTELSEIITHFWNDITLSEKLFVQIKQVYDNRENLNLAIEQNTLLEDTYSSFVRNGALLNKEEKDKLREIGLELSKITLQFQQNVLAENNDYKLIITDKADLAGLPESIIVSAQNKDNPNEWIFDLSYPSYIPFMQYADNRELRKELFYAFNTRGAKDNQWNNRELIRRITLLRKQRAQLLGFETHADYVLEKRVLQNPAKVKELLDTLLIKAIDIAQDEITDISEFAKSDIDELRAYDYGYYSEKIKQARYQFDENSIREYFPLNQVLQGVFDIANSLYGIVFIKREDIPVYHSEVEVYEVQEADGSHIGILYLDFYPRPGKQSGAWMTPFRCISYQGGEVYTPHISLVMNFSRPQGNIPSLLTLQEVLTLFHEFGHGLHGLLGEGLYPSLTGINVYWDFVELPSQLMENWVYEPQILQNIGKHWQTGESLSEQDIKTIQAISSFHEAAATVRQVRLGRLDLAWHYDIQDLENTDITSLENQINQETKLFPDEEGTLISPAFSHIFSGGYSAGYYSYKYSELLDADAFEYFLSGGKILDSEIGAKFREHILSRGGSEHPLILYKRFRGQEPNIDALLRRLAKSTK